MNTVKSSFLVLLMGVILMLAGCSQSSDSSPGPLKGQWHVTGIVDMVMTFRDGETETKGIVEKVTYKIEPKKVLVTYQSGMAKGMTQTYILIDKDTVESSLGIMKRIQ